MRVLFSLLSAGFLKNFESVIVEMADRGHEVALLIHAPTGLVGAEDLGGRLAHEWPTVSVSYQPVPRDGWQELSIALRACLDYLQFSDPMYHEAYRLRARARAPRAFRRLSKLPVARTRVSRRVLKRVLTTGEAAVPLSPGVQRWIAERRPDVAIFSPYIGLSTVQPSHLHAARDLGIPTAVCVGSWDHLTSKSLMRPLPDLVTVWNETQRREAMELHDIPQKLIVTTGAQLFDQWFDWAARPREAFCAEVGLDPARPFLLYTCFSPFKDARPETEFVRGWIERLRASGDPRLAEVGLLIRPHPKRTAQWRDIDLSEYDNVTVWPRDGRFVVDAESKAGFYDSLFHSHAVVGLNTSAMIEAAIVGRRVHAVIVPEYWESQEGTLHFRYLLEVGGGLLRVARSDHEHLAQLADSLARDRDASDENRAFVECFVRPHGLDVPATPRFVDAIEALAGSVRPRRPHHRRLDPALRALLAPAAAEVRRRRRAIEVRVRQEATRRPAVRDRAASRSMRILFQMPYSGYLRIYGSTVRELAARGHTVLLSYDSAKRRDPTAAQIEATDGIELVAPLPTRAGRLLPIARCVRLGADYARYLDPRYRDADVLRRRMDRYLPAQLAWMTRLPVLPGPIARAVVAVLRASEHALPTVPRLNSRLSRMAPDCVVVTPLLARGDSGMRQTDTVRSARAARIPVALAVTSWDHLTSKGLIKGDPDRVLLWNEAQRREAIELHGVAPERIVVTGAQLFDQWFDREPTSPRETFMSDLGLDPAQPLVLYTGSSPNITPAEREIAFVRDWLGALRADPALRHVGVLVRPHPGNVDAWAHVDLAQLGAAVSPRTRTSIPMDADDEQHYFHSLAHSAAIVGANTSAMIEAAIVGRPVLTVRFPGFAQDATLHFRLLLSDGGGPVEVADDLAVHCRQLAAVLADPRPAQARVERFVAEFVRPRGREQAATRLVADAIQDLDGRGRHVRPLPRRQLWGLVLKHYRSVARSVARAGARPAPRDEERVSGTYESHYASDNAAYARSRDMQRDVFFEGRTPVYANGWYTIRFRSDLLVERLEGLSGASVLEVGSGRGTNLALLAMRRSDLSLTGLELTTEGVARARELVADPPVRHVRAAGFGRLDDDQRTALSRVSFHQASALDMPFPDDSFDVSFTCLVLEQLWNGHERVLREMRRVTRSHCVFLEPFADANGPLGKAYLRSLDYFRARSRDFARYGLEPVSFTTKIPQKVHFRTGLLVCRVLPAAESQAARS
ncbi:MAG: methyltransferase domain-containing protein [Solirubrobacteraceae bacterium]